MLMNLNFKKWIFFTLLSEYLYGLKWTLILNHKNIYNTDDKLILILIITQQNCRVEEIG